MGTYTVREVVILACAASGCTARYTGERGECVTSTLLNAVDDEGWVYSQGDMLCAEHRPGGCG